MHKLFYVSGEFYIFEDESLRRHNQPVRSRRQMFTDLKKIFTSKLNEKFVMKWL